MTEHRIKEISDKAVGLWTTYLAKHPHQRCADLLNPGVQAALNTVYLNRLLKLAVDLFLKEPEPQHTPLVGWSSTIWGTHKAPSWLWHIGGNTPKIFVDKNFILSGTAPTNPRTPGETQRLITRLVLHEIGHVVLHWEKLKSAAKSAVFSADENDEEEAWFFCGVILGLALGDHARSGRPKIIDRAWECA